MTYGNLRENKYMLVDWVKNARERMYSNIKKKEYGCYIP